MLHRCPACERTFPEPGFCPFDGKPLVPGIKALLAHIHGDPQWVRVDPPLSEFPAADRAAVIAGYETVRANRVA